MKDELSLYFWSRRNRVGMLGALTGIGLTVTGITAGIAFWPLIPVALYGAGALITPREKEIQLQIAQSEDTATIKRELEKVVALASKELPQDMCELVNEINQAVNAILERTKGKLATGDRDLHAVRRTATTYLPDAITQYLSLPSYYARNHKVADYDGRTPTQELKAQLEILRDKMNEVLEAVLHDDFTKLRVHGNFLRNKFTTEDELAIEGDVVPRLTDADDLPDAHEA